MHAARSVKAAGWKTMWRSRTAGQGETFSARIHGTDLTIRARTPDFDVALYTLGGEYRFLDHLLSAEYDRVIIDAGAHIGTATISLARRFPKATIVAIEPSSDNIALLRQNTAAFPNVEVRHAALSATGGGQIELRNRGTGQCGFTVIPKPADRAGGEILETVPTLSIDDLQAEFAGRIGFVKLDIEGAEQEIFVHSAAALGAAQFVFVELHDRIVPGCTEAFLAFSADRWVIRFQGEKYLSIRK